MQDNPHLLFTHLPPIVNRVKGISKRLKSSLGSGNVGNMNSSYRVYRSYRGCIVDKALLLKTGVIFFNCIISIPRFSDARPIFLKSDRTKSETYESILKRNNLKLVEASFDAKFDAKDKKYSMHSFGAQFAEVRVDPDLGQIRVSLFVGAFGTGRVMNMKTARSQLIGGITMGIGMALLEETVTDSRYGQIVNPNLGEYHVPVNADIPAIEAYFVEENDPYVNPIGAKGIGEIGITGVAAAIANVVYHATGKRIRSLPITLDKLI